jgi:hypothetical protein
LFGVLAANRLELGISAKPISDLTFVQVFIFVAATGGRTPHSGALDALSVGVEAAEGYGFCNSYRQNDIWGDLANINVSSEPNKLSEAKKRQTHSYYGKLDERMFMLDMDLGVVKL